MDILELLAPARNVDIGIAAIDCGADAVYVAGPAFGARQAAGNPMEDIRRLTDYAHRFGVRIFLTLNTILFDNELREAERLLSGAKAAGVDAIIAQDLAVWKLTDLPVHASTQCAIRTPEKARLYEGIGASRLVLEREMSLEQIKAIRDAVGCELEFFVHGALCVCYSGQCYMSERIAGRSANRGECIQACRSLYDLVDGAGNILVRNKALLSLKDYNLRDRLEDLAEAGICSFKIEGRLKSISYVRNVVRAYSLALDELVEANPGKYRRSSSGRAEGGFRPDLAKTFNRGYTQLFLDEERSAGWSSMDAPKSIGEEIGTVVSIAPGSNAAHASVRNTAVSHKDAAGRGTGGDVTITVRMNDPGDRLRNGDGFSFLSEGRGEIVGFRGDVCQGNRITCRKVHGLYKGAKLYRNLDSAFEKELDSNLPVRRIPVAVDISVRISDPATSTSSVTEKTGSTTETIGSTSDIIGFAADDTGRAAEDADDAAENRGFVTEDTGCASEDAGDAAENRGFVTEDTGCASEDAGDAAENRGFVTEDTGCASEDAGDAAENRGFVTEDTGCASEDAGDAAENRGFVTEDTGCASEDAGDAEENNSPATEEERSPSLPKRLKGQTYSLKISAITQDGRSIVMEREAGDSVAENTDRMRAMFAAQISKAAGRYSFILRSLEVETPDGSLPFLPASALNSVRRDLAAALEEMPCRALPLTPGRREVPGILETRGKTDDGQACGPEGTGNKPASRPLLTHVLDIQGGKSECVHLSYKANISNRLARETYMSLGAAQTDEAFEISRRPDAELMRTKYCIRHELGLCPVRSKADKQKETSAAKRLYLTNNGSRYPLGFDCANCEMVVKAE